jgi:hypothetical protein
MGSVLVGGLFTSLYAKIDNKGKKRALLYKQGYVSMSFEW